MLNVEIGTLCLYSPEVHCLHLTLITASLNGGWVPRVSRTFHFWQPVPRLKNAFMAGTMVQPRKQKAPVTVKISVEKEA